MDYRSVQGVRHHATIEGLAGPQAEPDADGDGFSGQEHSFPIMPLYKDVVEFVARTKTFYTRRRSLVAYGAPWTENYWFENESPDKDPKLRRWIPTELLDTMTRRRAQWFLPEEYGHTKLGKTGGRISSTPAGAPRLAAATGRCRESGRIGKPGTSAQAV
jgi:hypothetical protein